MDFFDAHYYRINKILLSCIGVWPYQRDAVRYPILVAISIISSTQLTAKICGLVISMSDIDVIMDSLPPLLVDLTSGLKLVNSLFNANKIRTLMNRIETDWSTLTSDEELKIFNEFAEGGRRFTIIYGGALYSAMVLFMGMPFLPVLLSDSTGNATGLPMLHNVEYFIDMQTFYFPILLHAYMMIIICITAIVALDAMFVIFVQHVCGLFSAIGYRLERLADGQTLSADINAPIHEDEPYQIIVECAQKHIRAIEFADLMESSYAVMHLLQAGLNMFLISVTGAQAVVNIDHPHEFIRQATLVCAQLGHLFFESFLAQRLIDHSLQLQQNLLNTEWYQTSFRTRKGMSFMIMRSQIPSRLTAGKFMTMSMETFSVIIRTSLSYFTMLRTFQ